MEWMSDQGRAMQANVYWTDCIGMRQDTHGEWVWCDLVDWAVEISRAEFERRTDLAGFGRDLDVLEGQDPTTRYCYALGGVTFVQCAGFEHFFRVKAF